MSRHLRLLREAGLVVGHRLVGDSRGVLYTIDSRRHGAITAWLAGTDVAGTLDPAAAAGIPPGRRTVNDPWRACGSGRVRVVFLKRTPRRSDIPARRFRGHCGQTQSSAH